MSCLFLPLHTFPLKARSLRGLGMAFRTIIRSFTSPQRFLQALILQSQLQKLDKVYYMRAAIGVIAGLVAGSVITPDFGQAAAIGIAVIIGIVFYFISFAIAKTIAKNVPKDLKNKVALDGLIPFMFMLLVFMIIMYTALHETSVTIFK